MDFVTFGLILDDLIFPDGHSVTGVLGGGGPQTAFGMRLWSDSVGLTAGVGADLPDTAWQWLQAAGVDREGVRVSTLPTPRATQFLEADGRRTHIWHVTEEVVGDQLSRALEFVPDSYRKARGFHFGTHPEAPDLGFAADLRALGGVVSLEVFKPADRPLSSESLRALAAAPNIFSPDWLASRSLVGVGQPLDVARRLIEAGAEVLSLRLGSRGSLVASAQAREAVRIPAVPVNAVEETGAGSAYCGGFLVGWAETHDLVEAGLRGTVSASFLVERIGVPIVNDMTRLEARKRLDGLRARIESVAL